MAEGTTTTTRPARTRASRAAATKPAAAKTTPAKAAAAKAEPTVTNVDKFTVDFEYVADTKQYAKFQAPDNMKGVVVGNIYAPLGTRTLKVLVVGATDEATE